MTARSLLTLLCILACSLPSHAIIARLAPDVSWLDASGVTRPTSSLRGQPIVLLIAPTPANLSFRRQLAQLKPLTQKLLAQKIIFIAAFTTEPGRVPSDIPFAIAADGPKVAFDYSSSNQFHIAIIGPDGNLDYLTRKILPGQRILDIVGNSFARQRDLRRP